VSTPEPFPTIRSVTPDSLEADLATGIVTVHPDIAKGLHEAIGGDIDFFVAESGEGKARGQVGVNWAGTTNPETRAALGLGKGNTAANIAFMEVPEGHRRRGIARALLQAVETEAVSRGYRKVFLSVAVGNTVARALYTSDGFVDTGLRRETPQFERSPDGTYGKPVRKKMDYLVKELGDS